MTAADGPLDDDNPKASSPFLPPPISVSDSAPNSPVAPQILEFPPQGRVIINHGVGNETLVTLHLKDVYAEILRYRKANPNAHIIFVSDVDNTLVANYSDLCRNMPYQLINQDTGEIMAQIKDLNVEIWLFTRGHGTVRKLKETGIDTNLFDRICENLGVDKGITLGQVLQTLTKRPDFIFCIDDDQQQVDGFKRALLSSNISCNVFRHDAVVAFQGIYAPQMHQPGSFAHQLLVTLQRQVDDVDGYPALDTGCKFPKGVGLGCS